MMLGRSAGLTPPAVALITMPDAMPPALLVERFDIRESTDDRRMLALEDLCSVLDLSPNAKYDGTMERVARAVRAISTDPTSDILTVIKRALFAWLIADGDMHLKNMAVLKIAEPSDHTFRSVRMAPLYDAVTTRAFPNLKHDRMALKLNGRDDNLRRADFRAVAANAGLRVAEADAAIDSMLHAMKAAIGRIALPDKFARANDASKVVADMLEICRNRLYAFD
jgi:serine/threonine-protein kinase HipA